MVDRPTGTVTFLFTDVEGSTLLWEEHPEEMRGALEQHDMILRSAIEDHGGYVFSTAGDAFAAAFGRSGDAFDAAIDAQSRFAVESWPGRTAVQVRMGLHVGEAHERDGDYFGPTLNRAARIMSAGHGGSVLLSDAAAALIGSASLIDRGVHRLKDLSAPTRIWEYRTPSSPDVGQALRTLDDRRHNLPVQPNELIGIGCCDTSPSPAAISSLVISVETDPGPIPGSPRSRRPVEVHRLTRP